MNKRLLAALLALVLVWGALCPVALADSFDSEGCSVQHIVLMDANSGTLLLEKNGRDKAYPASTTKIMTCILALENGDLDEEITVGEEVWRGFYSRSSLMGLSEGERITLRDLLYGLMLVSGNDAAAAIAVHIGGSIDGFADMMNAKAAELGMTGTHYVNPHGVHEDDHYTTAYDMALLARYAMQNSDFRAIVGRETYSVDPTNRNSSGYSLENSNKLIHTKEGKDSYEYSYATGIKTGDTNQALRCLVASATKGDVSLIAVLLRDEPNDNRFAVAKSVFEWGFANCVTVSASSLGLAATVEKTVANASFEDPQAGLLTLNADLSGVTVSGLQSDLDAIRQDPSLVTLVPSYKEDLAAPVASGDVVGTVSYQYNGAELFHVDLTASRDVAGMETSVLSPSASPLLSDGDVEREGGSSLLFWLLIAVLILLVIVVIKLLQSRNSRRYGIRRKRASNRRSTMRRR